MTMLALLETRIHGWIGLRIYHYHNGVLYNLLLRIRFVCMDTVLRI